VESTHGIIQQWVSRKWKRCEAEDCCMCFVARVSTGGGDVLKLEFMYEAGDTITVSDPGNTSLLTYCQHLRGCVHVRWCSLQVTEEGTCLVDVYELKVSASDWEIVSMFGRGGIDTVDKAVAGMFQRSF
jgi:hypothetical protein